MVGQHTLSVWLEMCSSICGRLPEPCQESVLSIDSDWQYSRIGRQYRYSIGIPFLPLAFGCMSSVVVPVKNTACWDSAPRMHASGERHHLIPFFRGYDHPCAMDSALSLDGRVVSNE
jgi:hypothetical protein